MNLNDYQRLAHKTSAFPSTGPLDHSHIQMATLGLCGETGELADIIKKYLYHSHPLARSELFYELGDILWYVAEACTALGYTLNEVAAGNLKKLEDRYNDSFSSEKSINRRI